MKNFLPQDLQPSELSLYIIRKVAYDILHETSAKPSFKGGMIVSCGLA